MKILFTNKIRWQKKIYENGKWKTFSANQLNANFSLTTTTKKHKHLKYIHIYERKKESITNQPFRYGEHHRGMTWLILCIVFVLFVEFVSVGDLPSFAFPFHSRPPLQNRCQCLYPTPNTTNTSQTIISIALHHCCKFLESFQQNLPQPIPLLIILTLVRHHSHALTPVTNRNITLYNCNP